MRWLAVVLVALAGAGAGRALHRQLFALVAPPAAAPRNAAYSPAATRLALQVARACAGGRTRRQVEALLEGEGGGEVAAGADGDLDRDGVALELSAGLFYDKRVQVKDDFADVQRAAGVLMCPLDLEHRYALAREEVDRWVHNRTRGRVRLPEAVVHPRSALVLLSAVSLRGRWLNPFVPFVTKELPFRNADLTESVVPTMQQIVYAPYAELGDLRARGVTLPFENEKFHLMLLLPDDERPHALADLEDRLRDVDCQSLSGRFAWRTLHVRVPRFRAEASVALTEALRNAGAADLFAADAADLSGGLAARGAALDAVAQAVFLDVREGGAEVDAATAGADGLVPAPAPAPAPAAPPRLNFHVDRPFLFYVLPRPATHILLQGRVVRM